MYLEQYQQLGPPFRTRGMELVEYKLEVTGTTRPRQLEVPFQLTMESGEGFIAQLISLRGRLIWIAATLTPDNEISLVQKSRFFLYCPRGASFNVLTVADHPPDQIREIELPERVKTTALVERVEEQKFFATALGLRLQYTRTSKAEIGQKLAIDIRLSDQPESGALPVWARLAELKVKVSDER